MLESCQEYPVMNATALSEVKVPLKVPGSSICVCQIVFVPEYGGYDRFMEFTSSQTHYFNNMMSDFSTHRMEVSKYIHETPRNYNKEDKSKQLVLVEDDDFERKCLFASTLLDSFTDLKLKDLTNTFHYVVYINPIIPPKTKINKPFPYYPYNQTFNPYECVCHGPDFTINSCYNVEDFISVNHIHVLGGKNMESNEMKVWTVLGGIHAG